jgi:sugar phosphate isomerase/epimerase
VAGRRPFGISTHLYHGARLGRDHLLEIAAHGFAVVELFATPTHFNYHNVASVAELQQWLGEAQLTLASVHAPVSEGFLGGRHGTPLRLASADRAIREQALAEVEHTLQIARRIPFETLIVHIGVPRGGVQTAPADSRDGARRSLDALQAAATPLGVRVAVEVIPNELSRPGSLAHFLDDVLEVAEVGICLDMGHAHLDGDVIEAIETVSEHLIAVDLHDNRGTVDEHLLPFDGTIDWPGALTSLQKVGYDRTLMLELTARGATKDTLARARQVRERMERMMTLSLHS